MRLVSARGEVKGRKRSGLGEMNGGWGEFCWRSVGADWRVLLLARSSPSRAVPPCDGRGDAYRTVRDSSHSAINSPTGTVAGWRSTREPTVTYASSVPTTPLSPSASASGHGITGTVPRVGLPLSCVPRTVDTSVGHERRVACIARDIYRFSLTSNVQHTGSGGERCKAVAQARRGVLMHRPCVRLQALQCSHAGASSGRDGNAGCPVQVSRLARRSND